MEISKDNCFYQLTLGMAEYRSGRFAEADAMLIRAADAGKSFLEVIETSAFYRAMSQFRQGRLDEARKLAIEATAKMEPLPKDEKNPLAVDLILWLAYKEAKELIKFDAAPAWHRPTRNNPLTGPRSPFRLTPPSASPRETTCDREMRITRPHGLRKPVYNFARMGSRCLPPHLVMLESPRDRWISSRRSYHGHQDRVRKANRPGSVPKVRSRSARTSAMVSKPGSRPFCCSSRSHPCTFLSAEMTVEWLRSPK